MRILFVAMGQSVHTARWISQISEQGWDIHVFDLIEGSVCPELSGVNTYTVHPPPKENSESLKWKSDFPFRRGAGFVKRNFPAFVKRQVFGSRVDALVKLIKTLKPDILHSLEMQNESYPLLEVKEKLGGKFDMPWIYSCWGNDIYHFSKQTEHIDRINAVLSSCDYFIADCDRDVELANKFGFRGEVLGVFPTAGGYDVDNLRQYIEVERPSHRKTIALKGYQSWQGRALIALDALRLVGSQLRGFKLEIFLPVPSVEESARELALSTGISLRIHQQTHNLEILKIFGRSRIGFSMSVTDGWPNAMLEAMIMGAFPVQSDTISTGEWITSGVNGILVPSEDPKIAADAIRRALSDDELVDKAAIINKEMVMKRIDQSLTRPKIINIYNNVRNQWH